MSDAKNQGEGDKQADKNYRERTKGFVRTRKVDKAAIDAVNITEKELEESRQAEAQAKKKARS